jgi:hypothetical protein
MSEEAHNSDLEQVAGALASLKPVASRINRDRLLFRAGQVTAGRRQRLWIGLSAILALSTSGLAAVVVAQPGPELVERIVYVNAKPTLPASESTGERPVREETVDRPAVADMPGHAVHTCFQLEQLVLRSGVDALPAVPAGADEIPGRLHRPLDWRSGLDDERRSSATRSH